MKKAKKKNLRVGSRQKGECEGDVVSQEFVTVTSTVVSVAEAILEEDEEEDKGEEEAPAVTTTVTIVVVASDVGVAPVDVVLGKNPPGTLAVNVPVLVWKGGLLSEVKLKPCGLNPGFDPKAVGKEPEIENDRVVEVEVEAVVVDVAEVEMEVVDMDVEDDEVEIEVDDMVVEEVEEVEIGAVEVSEVEVSEVAVEEVEVSGVAVDEVVVEEVEVELLEVTTVLAEVVVLDNALDTGTVESTWHTTCGAGSGPDVTGLHPGR
jgi:hypothetical protein